MVVVDTSIDLLLEPVRDDHHLYVGVKVEFDVVLRGDELLHGGASLVDMWRPEDRVVVIGAWSVAAMGGPVLGPMIGGFASQAKGWTWTIWIMSWLTGATWVFLALRGEAMYASS